jgi:cation diffusion facilitator CzcD-associated flavoprotein CzcO
MSALPVAIIGAGPYGLSLAAHLSLRRVGFRIFGVPMGFWRHNMPAGMHLKSEGFASNLYEQSGALTLKNYCAEHNIPYADIGLPISLDTFVSYGLAFQKRFVPSLEEKSITRVARASDGYALTASDGETFLARQVAVAVGINDFAYTPPEISRLPKTLFSHSSNHRDLGPFAGKDVAVIGGGSSATDLAVLLAEAGANPHLIARRASLNFNDAPTGTADFDSSFWRQIRRPLSGIGPGWRYKLFGDAPGLFRYLPARLRHRIVRRSHGPAGAWFVREKLGAGPQVHLGASIRDVQPLGSRVKIALQSAQEKNSELTVDHVIAATGFRVNLSQLNFLSSDIVSGLALANQTPVLGSHMQSSSPGLYFLGTVAANSFGPVMRFAFGAGYAARRVSGAIANAL